jgi:hypothetical protein
LFDFVQCFNCCHEIVLPIISATDPVGNIETGIKKNISKKISKTFGKLIDLFIFDLSNQSKTKIMKSINEITALELRNIFIEKNINHEYCIGDHGYIWVGFRVKTQYNWIRFDGENKTGVWHAETYSQNTGKTSRGCRTRHKVYSRFEKLINK